MRHPAIQKWTIHCALLIFSKKITRGLSHCGLSASWAHVLHLKTYFPLRYCVPTAFKPRELFCHAVSYWSRSRLLFLRRCEQ
jgi:hypothetical protein